MKRTLLLFSLCAIFIQSNAQQKLIFSQNKQEQYLLRSTPSNNADVQAIINMLASADGKPASSVSFEISTTQKLQAFRDNNVQISMRAQHINFRVSAPYSVRGFTLNNELFPSSIQFNLKANGNKIVLSSADFTKKINGLDAEIADSHFRDTATENLTLVVSNMQFRYSSEKKQDLQNKLNKISAYYLNDVKLNQLGQQLNLVNPNDAENLNFHHNNLLGIENEIASIASVDFITALNLNANDPINFKNRFALLQQQVADRRIAMNNAKANLFLYFYNVGLDLASRNKRNQAKDYFNRSLAENPAFAPSAYQLAVLDYKSGYISDADNRLRNIVLQMNPDPDIRGLSMNLLSDIYDDYIDASSEKIQQKKFNDAIEMLQKAKSLCHDISQINCNSNLNQQLSLAHSGIYNSMLDEGKEKFQGNDYEGAESRFQRAITYQQQNANYISSAANAQQMLTAVKQKRYDNFMNAAATSIDQQRFDQAFYELNAADSLQKKFGLVTDARSEQLGKKAAKPIIVRTAKSGSEFAQKNNLVEARKKYQQAISIQEKYNVLNDAEVNNELATLKKGIFTQECTNLQNQLDEKWDAILVALGKTDYLTADRLMTEAKKLNSENIECGIDISGLFRTQDSVRNAVVYQNMIGEALSLQSNGRFGEAISKYNEGGNYFSNNNVIRFGITHQELASFVIDKGSNEFCNEAGKFYLGQRSLEPSLAIYKALALRKYPSKYFKKTLEALGRELAIRDHKTNSDINGKLQVINYTSNDKSLSALGKSYLKTLKKIKKG